MKRRNFFQGSVASFVAAIFAGSAHADAKSSDLFGLLYRKMGTKGWALFAAYDSPEECQDIADGMLEGGPYEFRIISLR